METTLAHSLPTDERTLVRRAQARDVEAFGALVITAHFTTGETGLHTTIDIPQQGATGVQLKNVSYDDSRVYMELPGSGAPPLHPAAVMITYATLEEVFVPEFLPLVAEWISERVSR